LPLVLIPDFIPVAGFSDDLVAITALLGNDRQPNLTPDIRQTGKAQAWIAGFPPSR